MQVTPAPRGELERCVCLEDEAAQAGGLLGELVVILAGNRGLAERAAPLA